MFGTSNVELSIPNAGALGCAHFTGGCTSVASDSTITVNPTPLSGQVQFTRIDGQVASPNYDFIGVAEHELDEVLGLGSALDGCSTTPCVRPEDFFRYDQTNARSFTISSSAMAFLSINGGVSDLVQLNQDPNGDRGDFFSPGTTTQDQNAPCTAIVQNAFSCNGQVASVTRNSPEIQALAAMGWDPRFSTSTTNTIWQVNCTNGTIASTGSVATATTTVAGPLGALLGTPSGPATFSPVPLAGDVVEITGICVQDVTVKTSDLMLTDREGPDGSAADTEDQDGIEGQLEIDAAQRVVITGLSLGIFEFSSSFANFALPSDLAVLFVHDAATVTLLHSDVDNSPSYGLLARRDAAVTLLDDRFFFNGFDNGAAGIAILTNAKAMIGADDGSLSVLVSGSGGDGVAASVGSSVIIHAASLTGNGNRQLSLQSSSSARLSGSAVTLDMVSCESTHGVACNTAIEAVGSSMLRIENGASVSAMDSGSPVGAIALSQGSALLAQGATIKALATLPPTVGGSDNSVIALAGGNTICSGACNSSMTGLAVSVDHVSTLIQVAPAEFGYAAAQDMLFGGGTVQLQSTADLGVGTIGASGPPSLAWTTGTGAIAVSQNSSFRLQGGTAITGSLSLAQGSNGIFNVANGGTNSVSGGVSCPFVAIPAAHVAGQNSVQPNVLLLTSFFSTATPRCLPF